MYVNGQFVHDFRVFFAESRFETHYSLNITNVGKNNVFHRLKETLTNIIYGDYEKSHAKGRSLG